MSNTYEGYDIVLHGAVDAPQDVWAVFMPSVKRFVYEQGAPYGRTHVVDYTWGDPRVDLELTIEVWRDSAGVHARWKKG